MADAEATTAAKTTATAAPATTTKKSGAASVWEQSLTTQAIISAAAVTFITSKVLWASLRGLKRRINGQKDKDRTNKRSNGCVKGAGDNDCDVSAEDNLADDGDASESLISSGAVDLERDFTVNGIPPLIRNGNNSKFVGTCAVAKCQD